ncbi:type II secretion system protein [Mangrovimicrobium sediminis]|uniref:Type II secretion system protein n=1 Tax=Mangrovimicrobium sediminis TaxID=2562682 RepID=A0A4Z0M3U4_9GAMM|nr:type II secretion system protein [Haliea sp. SAOS-164]TGD74107.1 type II secretion system protein [Haliea sp. SAOS-164]
MIRPVRQLPGSPARGFTLVELVIAMAIAGLLIAVTVPGSRKLYQSMQYNQSVRGVLGLLHEARRKALDSGKPQDVELDTEALQITLNDKTRQLPEGFQLSVSTASEMNRQNLGVIRFYPEGSSTGGDLEIVSPTGRGVHITVDWLMGGVKQEAVDAR